LTFILFVLRGEVMTTSTTAFFLYLPAFGERGRLVLFRFFDRIGLPCGVESGAATSSRGPGRGGVELITVLAGNGSEGGKSGLELSMGTVTESEFSRGLFPTGVASLTGRAFGLPFGFRAGVIVRSSLVISMTSSAYCEDRFVALRVRILARSEMSGEKSGSIPWVVSLITVGSE
jgi:hypothetical protein